MNLLNLIQWGEVNNFTPLFEDVVLPDDIDKNALIDRIVYDNWDLEPRVTDYILFKRMVENFFIIKLDTYTKINQALNSSYNPIHNFDRYEEKDESRNNTVVDTNTRSNTSDYSNTTKEVKKETGIDNTEHKTSAYNSTQYQPSSIDNNTTTINNDNNVTDSSKNVESGKDNRDVKTDDTYKTNNHLYGNIGVTTTQQMITSEIQMRQDYNIYKLISLDFTKEFMLLLL